MLSGRRLFALTLCLGALLVCPRRTGAVKKSSTDTNPWANLFSSNDRKTEHVKGGATDGIPCEAGTPSRMGRCNEHCVCHKNKWRCCRIRKEITKMSRDELDLFISALKEVRKHRKTEAMFRYVVNGHITNAPFVHSWPFFLPWHRMWIFLFEEALRTIDCRVSVPYFDFTQHWLDWYAHAPFDDERLGGDGEGSKCCVKTGPFREGLWNVTDFVGGGCLRRAFNRSKTMPSPHMATLALALWKPEQLKLVSNFINLFFHDYLHDAMGGFMMLASASVDPTFWMLHGYLDKLWAVWQQRGPLFKNAIFSTMKTILPGSPSNANYTPADFFNPWNQGRKNVRVCYSSVMSDEEAVARGEFAAPSVPRHKAVRNFSPAAIVRVIQDLTKEELWQFSYMIALSQNAATETHQPMPNDCVWKETPAGLKPKINAPGLRLSEDSLTN